MKKTFSEQTLRNIGRSVEVFSSPTIPTMFGLSKVGVQTHHTNPSLPAGRKKLFESSLFKYIPPVDFNYKLPNSRMPEIAFIGRSNVGKSSLIEALTGTKGLVRISQTPGCTKTINFFAFIPDKFKTVSEQTVDHHRGYFVDMPGYGFASTSMVEQERWLKVLSGYISVRDQFLLRRIYLLVDARHLIKSSDINMMFWLNTKQIPYQVVMTKADLVEPKDLRANVSAVLGLVANMSRSACFPYVHTVSSVTHSGINGLQLAISEIMLDERYKSAPPDGGF